MTTSTPMPETHVLAIASHVVYGYVGNTMATFVMQSLGCEVSALHTVHFSNHTGYRQFKGTRATAAEILDLYAGLQQSHLTDFDVMLSGYAPGAEAVQAVGSIARDLKSQDRRLFWVMDPVMGDNGRLYVSEDVVPAYKALLPYADLILPNQFEAEVLSGVKITDLSSLTTAISSLHSTYKIPHIIVTSVRFVLSKDESQSDTAPQRTLGIIGSTIRLHDSSPRLFRITVPDIDAFFSGTGDMFAALMVARLREACAADGLIQGANTATSIHPWLCSDNVAPLQTPLARAAEKVCASMSAVLMRTKERMDLELSTKSSPQENETDAYLRKTKAAEVRVVRYQRELQHPDIMYKAEEITTGS